MTGDEALPRPGDPAEVVLREVGEDDWQLWRDLRHRCLGTDPDAFGSSLLREQGFTEDDWRSRLRRGRVVVAWVGGEPVGTGGWAPEAPDLCAVVAMWVEPAARGRGVGRAVLAHVLASVPSGAGVELWVTDGNRAQVLYERSGFVRTGDVAPLRPGSSVMKSRMRWEGSRTRKVLPQSSSDSTSRRP